MNDRKRKPHGIPGNLDEEMRGQTKKNIPGGAMGNAVDGRRRPRPST
jgi:hypothetical protein